MDDMFDTPANPEVIMRITQIVINLIQHIQQVKKLQVMFLMGMVDISEEDFADFAKSYERVMDNMAKAIHEVQDPSEMTTREAYDIIYIIQDSIPMVVELDNKMTNMGAKVHGSDGLLLSEYLTEAVKV